MIRECFLPEEGEQWYSLDYSQQEPRLTVHYAAITKRMNQHLPGALKAVEQYNTDPKTNFHKMVAAETGLDYKDAKILNLALTYGRGAQSTAVELGVSLEEAKAYIAKYHERVPFVKALDFMLGVQVEKNGFIKTLGGRQCRFPLWEPADWVMARNLTPVPLWKAQKQWPGKPLRRAWLHKKLNRLIQGSAADQTKMAMQGILNVGLGNNMLVQVHDELGFSFDGPEKAKKAVEIMVHAVELKVPTIVDVDCGPSWGEAKQISI
jgi:DNA polymerase I-like protein with 3'-5' exonuclease and polymerase domains